MQTLPHNKKIVTNQGRYPKHTFKSNVFSLTYQACVFFFFPFIIPGYNQRGSTTVPEASIMHSARRSFRGERMWGKTSSLLFV
jgi:hypothetical protein